MWDERPDRIPGNHEMVLPDLAEKWEISGDGNVYTFHLRKGVKLPAPSGREIVADDVVQGFKRVSAPLPGGFLWRIVPSMYAAKADGSTDGTKPQVVALDKHTVQVTTRFVDADFLSMTGGHWWAIDFYKDFYEPHEKDEWGEIKGAKNFKGCGAFQMKEYVPGSHITFVPNPNYYNPDLPYVDVMENRFMFEPSVAAAALRAGQLDSWGIMVTLPVALAQELEKVDSLEVEYVPGGWYWPWNFDLHNPPFNDVRVRRALALSIDREAWIEELYFGHGNNVVLMEPFLEYWNLDPKDMSGDAGRYYTTYDPEAAKKLLVEAGYPNGFEFGVTTSNAAAHVVSHEMIELAKAYFEAIGVTMKINVIDYGAWLRSKIKTGSINQSGIARPALSTFVHSMIHPTTAMRGGGAIYGQGLADRDPAFAKAVALMDEQRGILDNAQRLKKVHELQELWAQNLWSFYYPVPDSVIVNTKQVGTNSYNPIAGWNAGAWKYVWMKE
jgi:ABC-type transport system substrate-binding protein